MNEISTIETITNYLNPGRKNIRVNIIIPMTQKVISDTALNSLHIIAFPDLHPENYIFNSFIGGDIVLAERNGVENCILIGNGQLIKFGKFNSLQNLEAHGSDIRETGVEWGDGNFIAHRAIFHGCKGGDNNYLGVGTIVADLTDAGSANYFFHGTTVGFSNILKNKTAYKGSYIDTEENGNVGPSESAIEFENQRTGNKIPLGKLFHDGQFRFMKDTIIPRTQHLLSHLSLTNGGYIEGEVGKQPANGVVINHVLAAGEYFHGIAAKIVELLDKELAIKVTKLQEVFSYFLDGIISDSQQSNEIWESRENIYHDTFNVFDNLIDTINDTSQNNSELLHYIEPQPEKRFPQYQEAQKVLLINYGQHFISLVVQTKEDLLHCKKKIEEVNLFLESFLPKNISYK